MKLITEITFVLVLQNILAAIVKLSHAILTHVIMGVYVMYGDWRLLVNVPMDTMVTSAKEHPVDQIHVKMVEYVRYRDQDTFAIVLLDTRDQIATSRPVAQTHAKMVEYV